MALLWGAGERERRQEDCELVTKSLNDAWYWCSILSSCKGRGLPISTHQLSITVGARSIPAEVQRQLDVSVVDHHYTLILPTVREERESR